MFKLIKQEEIKNLEVEVFEFEHEATKTSHIHIKADDDEKGFMVGFKTLPYSDNGIMHILEHSVLQGSRDFPLKDPFTSLLKNSLQTFMNAMTYSDHTCYPFATQNKKDFFNLMHVYTNSVFFPLLRKEAFLQEGWRFEFTDPKDSSTELKTTGVVFNEMIGAMGSAYSHLWKNKYKALYPDTIYAHNSGGRPAAIPDLTYEEFCDYHKKYYHPSNAIFVTYGDVDYQEVQEKLEEWVLNEFEYSDCKPVNPMQTPFEAPKDITMEYPYKEDDAENNHFYLKMWNITDSCDTKMSFMAEFMEALLSGDASAEMLKALEDSKLAVRPFCYVADNGRDIFFCIGGEGVKEENFAKLDDLIVKTLEKIAKDGFSTEQIAKEFHQFELAQKTKSDGRMTYGLTLACAAFDAKNNDIDTTVFLKPEIALESLKQEALEDKTIFTKFIEDKFLSNKHAVNFTMLASKKAADEEAAELANIAKAKQATLTEEETQNILDASVALEKYQAERDAEGILPEFSTKDIPLDKDVQSVETVEYKDTTVYGFTAPTSGLTFFSRHGFIEGLNASELRYLNIYRLLVGKLGYGDKNYEEAADYASSISSGLGFTISINEDRFDPNKIYTKVAFGSKMLNENKEKVKAYIDDCVANLRFDEKDKIVSILKKANSHAQRTLASAGHTVSIEVAKTKLSKIDNAANHYNGIAFSIYLNNIVKDIEKEECYNKMLDKVKVIHAKVQKAYANSALSVVELEDKLNESIEVLFDENVVSNPTRHTLNYDLDTFEPELVVSDKTTANYCAMVMPAPYFDHELAGAYFVLSRIINDFTHQEIREKGGAYGGFASYRGQSEVFLLASYRDPNISNTFATFKKLQEWLEDESNITADKLEEGILQAIALNDSPVLKIKRCSNALSRFFDDVTDEDVTNFRQMILKTDLKQIRRVIDELIIPNLDNAVFSGFVNKEQYNKEDLSFKTVEF
ncbi:MAG: hypothetical protein CFH44_00145 [Proteobacteria bacterium]|nr:MAG: hypothetical protein CFH44_00145 [Pseudomonadota bacterium]